MDYRLVKQFLNNAVDAFFNFFYKIGDFFTVCADLFWAFLDIWYMFFSFFGNLIQYVYYLNLFIIDKLSMSGNPVFFWRKSYDSKTVAPQMAYKKGGISPIPRKYGGGVGSAPSSVSPSAGLSAGSKKISMPKVKAPTIQSAAPADKLGSYRPSSNKTNVFKVILSAVYEFFIIIKEGFAKFFKSIGLFFSGRMKPVKADSPAGRKSLIDDYMKEYEKKKSR